MRNNFQPIHLKRANEVLSKHLNRAEVFANANKEHEKKAFKRLTLWEKFLRLSKLKSSQ